MTVYIQDVLDLVQYAEDINVKLETILIPATAFATFKESLEQRQVDSPEDIKVLAGIRMVPHYPTVAKYHKCADSIELIMDFYKKHISDIYDVEDPVYKYFGIDRTLLTKEQALLNQNMGKADAISK